MKFFATLGLLVASTFLPASTLAQTPAPAPTPLANPHVLDDLALHLVVSDDYGLAGRRDVDPSQLGDQLTTVAAWIRVKEPHTRITVSEEASEADTAGFEVTYENEMRSALDDAVVRSKKSVKLTNGFPAMLDEITSGSGFTTQKVFAWVWADGVRGVAVQITGRLGELDEKTATAAFTEMRAVVFPKYRLQQPPR